MSVGRRIIGRFQLDAEERTEVFTGQGVSWAAQHSVEIRFCNGLCHEVVVVDVAEQKQKFFR